MGYPSVRSTSIFGAVCVVAAFVALPAFAVDFQGHSITPMGSATLTIFSDDSLVIENIGSSGNDGVDIALPNASGDYRIRLGELTTTNAPAGASLHWTLKGIVEGHPGPISITRTTNTGGGTYPIETVTDFSPIGLSTQNVRAYLGGRQVASYNSNPADTTSSALRSSLWPGDKTSLYIDGMYWGEDTWWGPVLWQTTTFYNWSLAAPQDIDRACNRPLQPYQGVSAITGMELRIANMSRLTIRSIGVEQAPQAMPGASKLSVGVLGILLCLVGGTLVYMRQRRSVAA